MVTTIASVAGRYGLPQNDNSPYGNVQKSIYDSVKGYLDEYRSSGVEGLTSRGMGRSTFGEQALNKQETDIFSSLANTFANNELTNYNADLATERQKGLLDYQGKIQQDLYNSQFQNKFGYDLLGKITGLGGTGGVLGMLGLQSK